MFKQLVGEEGSIVLTVGGATLEKLFPACYIFCEQTDDIMG